MKTLTLYNQSVKKPFLFSLISLFFSFVWLYWYRSAPSLAFLISFPSLGWKRVYSSPWGSDLVLPVVNFLPWMFLVFRIVVDASIPCGRVWLTAFCSVIICLPTKSVSGDFDPFCLCLHIHSSYFLNLHQFPLTTLKKIRFGLLNISYQKWSYGDGLIFQVNKIEFRQTIKNKVVF